MIRLEEIQLENWRQHEDVRLSFGPGVNLIVGRNGVGKSNLAQGVCRLITGQTSDDFTKTENLRTGAKKGSVSGTIRINDAAFDISRDTLSTRVHMRGDGIEPVRQITGITKLLEDRIGLQLDLLKTYAFIPQEDFARVVAKPDASYIRMLQRMFWIHSTESIRDKLRERALRFHPATEAIPLDELNHEIEERKNELEELLTKRKELKESLDRVVLKALDAIINCRDAAGSTRKLKLDVDLDYAKAKRISEKVGEQIEAKKLELGETKNRLDATAGDYEEKKKLLAQYKELERQHKSFNSRKETLLGEPSERLEPEEPKTPEHKLEELGRLVSDGEQWYRNAEHYIKHFQNGVCPTCKQTVEDAQKLIKDYESKLPSMLAHLEDHRQQHARFTQQWSDFKQHHTSWLDWRRLWETRRAALEAEERTIPAAPRGDVNAYERFVTAYEAARSVADSISNTLQELTEQFAGAERDEATLAARIVEMQKTIDSDPTDKEHDEAISAKDLYTADLASYNEMTGKIAGIEGELDNLDHKREQTKAAQVQNKRIEDYHDLLERSRDVLHPNNLPADIIRHFMGHLREYITEMLVHFQSPFGVTLNEDDLSFNCHFGDKVVPGYRLSLGQRYILAIAFIFGLNQMFAKSLGFITMDEPTAFLDDINLANIVEVFRSVQTFAKSTRCQVIVISHEESLRTCADSVIELT